MEKRYGINVAFLRKMSFNYLVKGARIVKSEADKITRLARSKGIPLPVFKQLSCIIFMNFIRKKIRNYAYTHRY